jgi:hypothetical protein
MSTPDSRSTGPHAHHKAVHDDPHPQHTQHARDHNEHEKQIPHPHPTGQKLHKSWWEKWWMVVVIPTLLVMAGLIIWSRMAEDKPKNGMPDSSSLIAQMKAAKDGWVEGMNSYGGRIKSQENNGSKVIIVTGIPNKPCVETSWALAREGQITVNDVFLPRLSAGKLAELCSEGDNKSTIMWMPK